MGCLKRRVYPRDVTLNLSEGAPVPTPNVPGESWKEVVHNPYVTWLAFWKDPVNPRQFKYVFLGSESAWKGQSDLEKYEKARKLKEHIEHIRASYRKDFKSSDRKLQQMAVATYLIDVLALRAGHEKEEDEADTVSGSFSGSAAGVAVGGGAHGGPISPSGEGGGIGSTTPRGGFRAQGRAHKGSNAARGSPAGGLLQPQVREH